MDIQNASLQNLFFDPRNRETLDALVLEGREQVKTLPEGWSTRVDTRSTLKETREALEFVAPRVRLFLGVPDQELPLLDIRYDYQTILAGAIGLSGSLWGIYLIGEHLDVAGRIAVTGALLTGLGLLAVPKDDTLGKYCPRKKSISVSFYETKQRLRSILAHEYTHHLQHFSFDGEHSHSFRAFDEGHAMGVQKHITQDLAREEQDFAYIEQNDYLQRHLERAQRLFHEGQKGKEYSEIELFWASHAIGHALFQLAERKYDKGIYADALKGNFGFLQLWD